MNQKKKIWDKNDLNSISTCTMKRSDGIVVKTLIFWTGDWGSIPLWGEIFLSFLMIFYPLGYFQRAKKGLLHWALLTGPGSFKLKYRVALLMFMAKLHLCALPRNFNSRFTFTIKIETKMWKLGLFWQFLEKTTFILKSL